MVQEGNNLMKDQGFLHVSTWLCSLHSNIQRERGRKGGREEGGGRKGERENYVPEDLPISLNLLARCGSLNQLLN